MHKTHTHTHIYIYIFITECNSGTTQKLFEVNTAIELKNIITTSKNAVTLLSHSTSRHLPILSDVAVIYFSSILILNSDGYFLDSAIFAFSERHETDFKNVR
jgi:hypothetical protein